LYLHQEKKFQLVLSDQLFDRRDFQLMISLTKQTNRSKPNSELSLRAQRSSCHCERSEAISNYEAPYSYHEIALSCEPSEAPVLASNAKQPPNLNDSPNSEPSLRAQRSTCHCERSEAISNYEAPYSYHEIALSCERSEAPVLASNAKQPPNLNDSPNS